MNRYTSLENYYLAHKAISTPEFELLTGPHARIHNAWAELHHVRSERAVSIQENQVE